MEKARSTREPLSPVRRKVLQGLGAGTLTALLGGCVTPALPPRPLDSARAPRVGDSWQYQYRSAWAQIPQRRLAYTVLAVGPEGVRDRLSVEGEAGPGSERLFGSAPEIVNRALPGLLVHEFSPYLLAFGEVPAGNPFAVAVPPETFGTTWTGSARVTGSERVAVAAGTFDATRVDISATRLYIRGQMDDAEDPVWLYATAWFAPAAKRLVRFVYRTQAAQLNYLYQDFYELASYRLG
jgi:hypothetical protein